MSSTSLFTLFTLFTLLAYLNYPPFPKHIILLRTVYCILYFACA